MSNSDGVYLRHFPIRACKGGLSDKPSTLSCEGFQHPDEACASSFCFFQQNLLDAAGILDSFLWPVYHTFGKAQVSSKSSQNIFSYHLSIRELDSQRRRQLQAVLYKWKICERRTKLETSCNSQLVARIK